VFGIFLQFCSECRSKLGNLSMEHVSVESSDLLFNLSVSANSESVSVLLSKYEILLEESTSILKSVGTMGRALTDLELHICDKE
jgi:hypothetical protein